MKKILNGIVESLPVILVVFMGAATIVGLLSLVVRAEKSQTIIKVTQRQIAVESVRRGYAELVVNTNTGDFEVRLKEVAP